MKIEIISGTNRTNAVTKVVASYYENILLELGVDASIIDLAQLPHDFVFSALYEQSGKNMAFNPFRERMYNADKFVFIVPEYNGSFPGVMKAFIDGMKYPDTFMGKKCALVGLSSGIQGAGLAMSHLTDIFNYCGMHVLALKPKLSHISQHLVGGKITNQLYDNLLRQQAQQLIAF